jgi:hypothetical protein
MSTPEDVRPIEQVTVAPLANIVERQQVWTRMAANYGVENSVPPWKSSLDGICDALDHGGCGPEILSFVDRRNEEDTLSATVYSNLPYPENQLVSLAHSLVVRGVIDETGLQDRLASIRSRLQAG